MSLTNPPSHPPVAPPVPNRRTDGQHEFDNKADAYLNWMVTFAAWLSTLVSWLAGFVGQLGPYMQRAIDVTEEHKNSANAAASAAETSARLAALAVGAGRWQAGAYTQGAVVWSPISLLTYRRISTGSSTQDPAQDHAGWRLMGAANSFPQVTLNGPGPHQLVVGMHYLLADANCVAIMPTTPYVQEQVRITNISGQPGPVLQRGGKGFLGRTEDLRLNARHIDYCFTYTSAHGWI